MLVVAVGDRKKIEADWQVQISARSSTRDADGNVIAGSGSGAAAR